MIEIIDLNFQNTPSTIACFLVKGKRGYILVESGPASTYNTLHAHLNKHGIAFKDIVAVLITHIHLDHSGAAWALAKEGIPIYVHPLGAPHLISPNKLIESATRIYGDQMDALWGEIAPIEKNKVITVDDEEELLLAGLKIKCFYTPGHASHHVVYMIDGVYFAGDLCAVKIDNGPIAIPAPPPDVHIELWVDSIERMRSMNADEIYICHFGKVEKNSIEDHYNVTEIALNDLKNWVEKTKTSVQEQAKLIELLEEKIAADIRGVGGNDDLVKKYFIANPPFMSVGGMLRYFKKHIERI